MALAVSHPIKILVVDRSFCNFVNVISQIFRSLPRYHLLLLNWLG